MDNSQSIDFLNYERISQKLLNIAECEKISTQRKFYIPRIEHLQNCLKIVNKSSFLKEEGRDIEFNLFLGTKEYLISRIFNIPNGWTEDDLMGGYINLAQLNIKLSPNEIRKLAPVADREMFTIHVSPVGDELMICGLMYFPEFSVNKYYPRSIKSDGFFFSVIGEGKVRIFFNSIKANIYHGEIHFFDDDQYLTDYANTDLHFATQFSKFFSVLNPESKSNSNRELTHPFKYTLRKIEENGHGAIIIFANSNCIEKNIKQSYTINHKLVAPENDKANSKTDIYYKHFMDLVLSISKVDGAVLISPNEIIGFGATITVDKQIDFPSEFLRKGERHKSAYAFVKASHEPVFVFVVSADRGVMLIYKENDETKFLEFKQGAY